MLCSAAVTADVLSEQSLINSWHNLLPFYFVIIEEEEDDSHHYETLNLKPTPSSVPSPTSKSIPLYSVPTINLHSCIQVNNCIIRLIHGDISEHIADVLVHSGG